MIGADVWRRVLVCAVAEQLKLARGLAYRERLRELAKSRLDSTISAHWVSGKAAIARPVIGEHLSVATTALSAI